jgi:hypothetical protein
MLCAGKHLPYLTHGRSGQAFNLYAPRKEDLPLWRSRRNPPILTPSKLSTDHNDHTPTRGVVMRSEFRVLTIESQLQGVRNFALAMNREHKLRPGTATPAIAAPSFHLRAPNRLSSTCLKAKFCFRLCQGHSSAVDGPIIVPKIRTRSESDCLSSLNFMRRSRSEPREDLEKVIRGLKFVSLVLFSLPLCVSVLILAAAVMTSGHRPGVPIFPLNSQWASLLSCGFRISIIPGFAVLVYCVVSRLRYRPLEHRLAFVAFSLMSLIIFVFAPSRSRSRDGVNPAVTLELEKENEGVYSVPGASDTIEIKNIPVATPLSRQAVKDPSTLQNAKSEL